MPTTPAMSHKRLREIRNHLGLTGQGFADILGLDPATYKRYEAEPNLKSATPIRRFMALLVVIVADYILKEGCKPSLAELDAKITQHQNEHKLQKVKNNALLRQLLALTDLDEREATIIQTRHLTDPPTTLEELGQHYGITRERVRQIETLALEKLEKMGIKPQADSDNAKQFEFKRQSAFDNY